jgi:uncharacterized small protein (DUF1192 family)
MFRGKKWWQVALIILPWIALVTIGSCLWFLAPGRLTNRYAELARNAPLNTFNEGAEEHAKALREQQQKLAARSREIESRIAAARTEFDRTKATIATETHDELRARLYGETND